MPTYPISIRCDSLLVGVQQRCTSVGNLLGCGCGCCHSSTSLKLCSGGGLARWRGLYVAGSGILWDCICSGSGWGGS